MAVDQEDFRAVAVSCSMSDSEAPAPAGPEVSRAKMSGKDFNASRAFQAANKRPAYVAHRDVKLTDGEKSAHEKLKISASNGICSRCQPRIKCFYFLCPDSNFTGAKTRSRGVLNMINISL